MAHQVLDPLGHGLLGHVQLRGLLPITALGHRGLGRQHQAVVDVGPYDHPVFSSVIPLARAIGLDVRDRALGPKLELVGIDQARALLGPPQHVELPEQADRWPHTDEHLTKVDEDHHQNEGVRRQVLRWCP
jgi:hypothetical protein